MRTATSRPIQDVRFVKADGNARLFAIYLDEYYVSAGRTQEVRDALHRFVDQDLHPDDLVTILRPLDSLLSIRLTRDRDSLHRAIDAFEGRRGDYAPRTAFERNYMVNDQAHAEVQRTQSTWSTLNALALHLANLGTGRKTMLLVSEQADPMLRRRGLESLPTSSSVMRTANRANVAIYVSIRSTRRRGRPLRTRGRTCSVFSPMTPTVCGLRRRLARPAQASRRGCATWPPTRRPTTS